MGEVEKALPAERDTCSKSREVETVWTLAASSFESH